MLHEDCGDRLAARLDLLLEHPPEEILDLASYLYQHLDQQTEKLLQ